MEISRRESEDLNQQPEEQLKEFFITRHSKKPKDEDLESKRYPGVSEKGVELSEERAKELAEMVEKSESGSVIFISGGTDLVRTKSTAEAYGDKLADIMEGREDVIVMTRSGIQEGAKGKGYSKAVSEIASEIKANPDKKIVVDFPLFLKELSPVAGGFYDKNSKLTPWAEGFIKSNKGDEYAAFREWLRTKENAGDVKNSNSEDMAKKYKIALERLHEFAKDKIGDRPLVVGAIGHSWYIDAFLTYMVEGKVDLESFDKVAGGGLIGETEMAQITIKGEEAKVNYRGKEFVVDKK